MLKNLHNRLSVAKDWYHVYKKEVKLIANVRLKNTLLYQELEEECDKQGGMLTYAEYLNIEQFGKHGFYAASGMHGKTDVDERWGSALARYCIESEHETIIEFGCGLGDLGVATAKEYKQLTSKKLKWIGVEIDTTIHKTIFEHFTSQQVGDSVLKIATNLEEIPVVQNALLIFPYSLDNIPPQIFVNTKSTISYPNALLGLTVANGTVSEVIIPPNVLQKKGLQLENGFFTQNHGEYKLTNWKLRKGQRAYIPIDSYGTIYQYTKKFKHATLVIIDEFRKEPLNFNLENLGTPKSLYEKNLVINHKARYYRESGQHNLYYPLYKDSLLKFLSVIGFRSIDYEIEQNIAAKLRKKRWFPWANKYATYVFFAKDFADKRLAVIPIPFSHQRIF